MSCCCVYVCSWNGYSDNWGGGKPGDGKTYTQTATVDYVSITPFNEPNDIMYPTPLDQPDGCEQVYYTQGGVSYSLST